MEGDTFMTRRRDCLPRCSVRIFRKFAVFLLLTLALVPMVIVHLSPALLLHGPVKTNPTHLTHPLEKKRPSSHQGRRRTLTRSHRFDNLTEPDFLGLAGKTTWDGGCYDPEQRQLRSVDTVTTTATFTLKPPTGIVIMLVTATDDRRINQDTFRRICKVLPAQVDYFLKPQRLDLLLVVQEEPGWTLQSFLSCLHLYPLMTKDGNAQPPKIWQNLDGSTMAATPYQFDKQSSIITIYAGAIQTEYPLYIQQNPSLLQNAIAPPSCEASRKYIQATRWYTREMLHLGILQDYDYFLKVDTDIIFVESIPFHVLHDVEQKRAVFAHTAQYHPKGSKTCTMGIRRAVEQFLLDSQRRTSSTKTSETWTGDQCSSSPELMGDVDWYYTNLIIGRVDFWQSQPVLDFATYLSEFPDGFFKYRWTDQIFWHHAMGLFVHDYNDYVADYSNLRCMPDLNCWYSSYNFNEYGTDAWHRCDSGGYFLHPKDYHLSVSRTKKKPMQTFVWNSTQPLFQSTYKSDCSATQQQRQKRV